MSDIDKMLEFHLKAVEIFEAVKRGAKIQCRAMPKNQEEQEHEWVTVSSRGLTLFPDLDYRIQYAEDSIDWSAVHPDFNYMARDGDGDAFLFKEQPRWSDERAEWIHRGSTIRSTEAFASYKNNGLEARYSLTERPKCQA